MKIAFIYDVPYPWHIGGIEAMNFNEAKELAKHHEVHYFTTKWPGMKSSEFTKDGIKYHAYGETDQTRIYQNGRRSISEALSFKLSLSRLFSYKFDVVITNQFPILHLPAVKLFCFTTEAKLIMEVAEVWDEQYWKTYLGDVSGMLAYSYSQFLIEGADAYVTISSKTTEELRKIGVKKKEVHVFSPAIDDSLIKKIRRSKRKQTKTIIFSGRLIKEKRVDKWIDIFAKAYKKDNSLSGLVIGKGPERERLEAKIKSSGLSGKVQIRNFYEDTSKFYKEIYNSALMLHMSGREGLGIIAIESIALGTPVILPKATPLPKEISEMCLVSDEKKIPDLIIKVANSKNKSKYIKNTWNLEKYYKSQINGFYSKLFKEIGLHSK